MTKLDPDTQAWLQTLPLNSPVTIDGIEVWLRLAPQGAELAALLIEDCSEIALHDALSLGLAAAFEFDAGFGLSPDERSLILSQWLPGVADWVEAAPALEKLLDQVEALEVAMRRERDPRTRRHEQRMRGLLGEQCK